ncbi:hypothetical protein ACJRO7_033022 [Eucalyptus globulus]|uniref:Uncharacterized protein n=1 Tax=Eucalyptus globulus TaxID=34317 RepID=A0ABD3JLR1_EUCGL
MSDDTFLFVPDSVTSFGPAALARVLRPDPLPLVGQRLAGLCQWVGRPGRGSASNTSLAVPRFGDRLMLARDSRTLDLLEDRSPTTTMLGSWVPSSMTMSKPVEQWADPVAVACRSSEKRGSLGKVRWVGRREKGK